MFELSFNHIMDVERQMRTLERDMATLDGIALERAINRYAHVTARFEAMSGYDIEEKFSEICISYKQSKGAICLLSNKSRLNF